jgi:hypothetical protein
MGILLHNAVIEPKVEIPHRTVLTKAKADLEVRHNGREGFKDLTKDIKVEIQATIKDTGQGRSSTSSVGDGMNLASVGMKVNHGHVEIVVVTTLLPIVGNQTRSSRCLQQW